MIIPLQTVTLVFDKWRPVLGTLVHTIPPAWGFVTTVLQYGHVTAMGGSQEPHGREKPTDLARNRAQRA